MNKQYNLLNKKKGFYAWYMYIFVAFIPLFLIISCDSSSHLPGAIDGGESDTPPPVSNLNGPPLTESAPAPCIQPAGPEEPVKSLDTQVFNKQGLPASDHCVSTIASPPESSIQTQDQNVYSFVDVPGGVKSTLPPVASKQIEAVDVNHPIFAQSEPGAATLTDPSGTANSAAPKFEWEAVTDATWYLVWVRDSGTMNFNGNPRINHWITADDAGCGDGSGTCSWWADKNLEYGDGTWWIQTWNSSGYGPWSNGMDFTIPQSVNPPASAILSSPNTNTDETEPTFEWDAVSNATWYLVWVRDSQTMSGTPKIKKWVSAQNAGCGSGSGTCSWASDTQLAEGNAKWWIQTWNEEGFGPWSSAMNFSVEFSSVPEATTLVSPSGNTGVNPEFKWEAVSNATWYRVWIRDSETLGTSEDPRFEKWVTADDAGCASGSGTCSFQLPSLIQLEHGNAKFWIRTWNDAGHGPWSSAMDFTVSPPERPVTISPDSDSLFVSNPTFTWEPVENGDWYRIEVFNFLHLLNMDADEIEPLYANWIRASDATCANNSGTCELKSDASLNSTNILYVWSVRSWQNGIGVSEWAGSKNFGYFEPRESCKPIDRDNLRSTKGSGGWIITDDRDFEKIFDDFDDFTKANNLLDHYEFDTWCAMKKTSEDDIFEYFLVAGQAPEGSFGNEDCLQADPWNWEVEEYGSSYRIVEGNIIWDLWPTQEGAENKVDINRKYNTGYQCFVGRPNPSLQYFRK